MEHRSRNLTLSYEENSESGPVYKGKNYLKKQQFIPSQKLGDLSLKGKMLTKRKNVHSNT